MDMSNLSNLNDLDLLSLFSIFNKKNKTITGERFYVGEGILKCDNYFISLDSICMVELNRPQNSEIFAILMIVLGVFLCFFCIPLLAVQSDFAVIGIAFGCMIVLGGIFGIIYVLKSNKKIPYSMSIHLNDKTTYTFHSLNKEFILSVMQVIQSCINDRRGGYNILMNQSKIERNNNNNSININGNINNTNGDFVFPGASKTISGDNTINANKYINNNNNNAGLTSEDWMKLEEYFMMRQKEFSMDDRNYQVCSDLITYSQRKDAGKIKGYLQTMGRETLRLLFTASTNAVAMETIKPIVNKILSLKG